MPNLSADSAISILAAITAVFFILYIREYFARRNDAKFRQSYQQQIKEKSIRLLQAAEEAETQILSEGNYVTQNLISEFKIKLDDMLQNSRGSLISSQDKFIKFMDDLQKSSRDFEEASRKSGESRINAIFDRLEERLSDFLVKTEQQTISSIELELKAARNLIDSYKNQQLKLIDENIIAMMEQTLNLVLSKKLSLKDQLDLIYEALEKAKIEKFVV